jgi:transcription elongation factor/antiterminator RfaH
MNGDLSMITNTQTQTETLSWYAIHTHAKQEDRADENLQAWQVETFAPKLRARRSNAYARTPTYFTKPLFPRYIFARFKSDEFLHKVRYTRGVVSVVGIGSNPSPIDDQVISIIKSQSDAHSIVKFRDGLEVGNEVVINDGPMRGFTGIFERSMKDSDRVMILLNTVSYQSHIVIERELVRKTSTLD